METLNKSFKFNFKSRKVGGEDGGEATVVKHPAIECELPVLSASGIVEILTENPESKESQLIVEAVGDIVYLAARGQFADAMENLEIGQTITSAVLDFSKLAISYIANLPKSQRGAAAITEEEWAAFFADYRAVMVPATGKPEKNINNHIDFYKKPNRIRYDAARLEVLVQSLDLYISAASESALEVTGAAANRLRGRLAQWLEECNRVADDGAL